MNSPKNQASLFAENSSGNVAAKTDIQAKIKEELSSMSFEELRTLKEELGTKIVNSTLFGKNKSARKRRTPRFKRENKNRPREISSKRKRNMVAALKTKTPVFRDPRFDDLSGNLDEILFNNSYRFLYDMKSKEIQTLKRRLENEKDERRQKEIKYLIQKMEDELKTKTNKDKRKDLDKNWKEKQVEKLREGKKPYYLKNSEKKKQELVEKFEALRKSGKLEQYLAKKRKKNASKLKKKLPL